MTEMQKEIMNALMVGLQRGELTPAQLCQGITDLIGQTNRKPQDILYLQARNTSPESQVVGMMQIEGGKRVACLPDPDDWPYQTVLDAVKDGWRIISFPNMSLLAMDEKEVYGLGFEFILER
ncbi:hypothetical protein F4X33_02010 [Candidatus Poribacteria bacterium]|nr:hypothetical protein [Candidatus Poribacteria bacterium]